MFYIYSAIYYIMPETFSTSQSSRSDFSFVNGKNKVEEVISFYILHLYRASNWVEDIVCEILTTSVEFLQYVYIRTNYKKERSINKSLSKFQNSYFLT